MTSHADIILENKRFILTIGSDCTAKSLVLKSCGEECLLQGSAVSLFSLTENRPYNNEIKLSYPNKRTTFQANRIRREGNRLIVGFELVTFEAVLEFTVTDAYMSFTLIDFIIPEEAFAGLAMSPPPVSEFRLLQLPLKQREHFGEWLNVLWDDTAAVNVLAADPYVKIDSAPLDSGRLFTADSLGDVKLLGRTAALIVSPTNELLDCIDALEVDFDLPRGVQSRRNRKAVNSSIYWTGAITPQNVHEHIALSKQMGFTKMLIYYGTYCRNEVGYSNSGDYEFNDDYPNGIDDLKFVVDTLRSAGITPGMHILQTHIGLKSHYVTPHADHRLRLTRYFTLSQPLSDTDTTIYVEQDPTGTVMHPQCRVLKFGGELIEYESYVCERPYRFVGCKRGHLQTEVKSHELGTIGGILDVSEFSATSAYIDQDTSLQDEIADKIAKLYALGFEFLYFDGSEGTNAPFEIYIPLAQYKVYQKLSPAPLFCEGAAKSHFGWHMLSGGNAFDVCLTCYFKGNLLRHQLPEAARLANDFTRINFGWWGMFNDSQPHLYEYGTSKAASWDSPVTLHTRLPQFYTEIPLFQSSPRLADNLEVLRRWEDVRRTAWLTDEQKKQLRDPDAEYTLLINEEGEYELVRYFPLETAPDIIAYSFERRGKQYVVYWHESGNGTLLLEGVSSEITLEQELGTPLPTARENGALRLPVGDKLYLSTSGDKQALLDAFGSATIAE